MLEAGLLQYFSGLHVSSQPTYKWLPSITFRQFLGCIHQKNKGKWYFPRTWCAHLFNSEETIMSEPTRFEYMQWKAMLETMIRKKKQNSISSFLQWSLASFIAAWFSDVRGRSQPLRFSTSDVWESGYPRPSPHTNSYVTFASPTANRRLLYYSETEEQIIVNESWNLRRLKSPSVKSLPVQSSPRSDY